MKTSDTWTMLQQRRLINYVTHWFLLLVYFFIYFLFFCLISNKFLPRLYIDSGSDSFNKGIVTPWSKLHGKKHLADNIWADIQNYLGHFHYSQCQIKIRGKLCSNEWLSNYSNSDTRDLSFILPCFSHKKNKNKKPLSYTIILTTNSYITNKSLNAPYNTMVTVTLSNFHTRTSLIYHTSL